MNPIRLISCSLMIAIISMGTMSAVINLKDIEGKVKPYSFTVTSALVSNKFIDKNEHAQKAFIETVGVSLDKPNAKAGELAENFLMNYSIRKGTQLLNDRGIAVDKKAVLKAIDVLPNGVIRDVVNPVVEGTVNVATHPETLTMAAIYVLHELIIPALSNKK